MVFTLHQEIKKFSVVLVIDVHTMLSSSQTTNSSACVRLSNEAVQGGWVKSVFIVLKRTVRWLWLYDRTAMSFRRTHSYDPMRRITINLSAGRRGIVVGGVFLQNIGQCEYLL